MDHNAPSLGYGSYQYNSSSILCLKDWHHPQCLPRCVAKKENKGKVVLGPWPREPRPPIEPVAPRRPVFDFANPAWSPRHPNDPAGNQGAYVYTWWVSPFIRTSWGEEFAEAPLDVGHVFEWNDPRTHWNVEGFEAYILFQRNELVVWQSEMVDYSARMYIFNADIKLYQRATWRYRNEVNAYEAKVRKAMNGRLFLSELGWGTLSVLWFLTKVVGVLLLMVSVVGLLMFLGGFFKAPKVDGNLGRNGVPKAVMAGYNP